MNVETREKSEKKMCYILRHHPEEFGINLDDDGFCSIDDLCNALNINTKELNEIIALSNKHRFEIVGDRVRALYGHSFKERIVKKEVEPPCYLYHGTTSKAYETIKTQGLKSMNRQYVHLSVDLQTAKQVGKRRQDKPCLLRIKAGKAYKDGYKFYEGNDSTILADEIPSKYIEFINGKVYKGIFWIVDKECLENNDGYFFLIEANDKGEIISAEHELTSKNKDNYNHKTTWQSLSKNLTHNKDFDYYPRGRVEIKNGKYKLFLNPTLIEDRILDYIKSKFGLPDNVIIIADNSKHYHSEI